MKRQGRQHGMVRTYPVSSEPWSSRRKQRDLNEPLTAGLFSKVSSKPTNHSKFTAKCGRSKCHDCHIHPASKSKDKVKGAQKMRSSSDVVSNYRLITWRVVDSTSGFNVSGFSATGILDYLDHVDDYDYEYDRGEDSDHDDVGLDECYDPDHNHYMRSYSSHDVEIEEIDGCDDNSNDDDDRMSFCEVGFVWEAVDGDESWCLVDEI